MNQNTRRPRHGSIMIVAIVCMAIVTSLVFTLARHATQAKRETRLRLQLLQTERLLDAGILRAQLRSKEDPDYSGEKWSPAISIGTVDSQSEIDIQVDKNKITVTASIGQSPHRTTETHTFITSEES